MTQDAEPLRAYAVSTAVGSGKTRAAVEYIASKESACQNFIYVAPTIRLIEQTTENLRKAIGAFGSDRDVSLIHSESTEAVGMPVSVHTVNTINETSEGAGAVVVVTTTTFLKVLSTIKTPRHWSVIIDEGFSPVEFFKVRLGERSQLALGHFRELFAIDPEQNYRVLPADGEAQWVERLALQGVRRTGDRDAYLQPLAARVANPVMRCELMMTPTTEAIFDGVAGTERDDEVLRQAELEFACYVTPEWLPRFAEVTLMSALFERTMLHQFWTKVFGVVFEEHPVIRQDTLRNIHRDEGPNVQVGHLLHANDRSSKTNLIRNWKTGEANERQIGERVIDRLVNLASEHFKEAPFLLQTNNSLGYDHGSPRIPVNAVKVPTTSHGLNEFAKHDNVAALAVTNPKPSQGRWIMEKTGMDSQSVQMAFRLHTTYQAVGRSSIRKASPTPMKKTFLTVGHHDANMLHEIFEGSQWLGQIGDMQPLSTTEPDGGTLTESTRIAYLIVEHLNALPLGATAVTSRSLKTMLAEGSSSSTWTRAVGEAMALPWNWGWMREGQSVRRMTAEDYGFEVEEGYSESSDIATR